MSEEPRAPSTNLNRFYHEGNNVRICFQGGLQSTQIIVGNDLESRHERACGDHQPCNLKDILTSMGKMASGFTAVNSAAA